ncbi:uncharacterized protein SPPG_00785 [Spizellomyces punctatus DAOM BR117]|uniref:Elongin-A n=1 Tax=Spizellomyces punctatus (strain DAOM BR117) TaxID=645134 RepID=A0A0L0HVI3_SPIPD|nr:uncharacterized protein SPPG_00785 [Spizellomyces punctatus DAOM BR117]KND05113.1 hypothetical protein SPPG_00785 [Spizellomyces punctatus DAOM BR117]|eukprot:XP_016613152.1 hypothetical protein SPPG_00785 [Spizellomyces punctatus DAOM BR117]
MADWDDYEEVQLRQPPTLSEMCMRKLERNLNALQSLGAAPYYLVESLLRRCNAAQLERLEENSKNLLPDSLELWKAHCLADFADIRRGYEDETMDEPDSWRDLYKEKREERDEKTKRIGERMKALRQQEEAMKESRRARFLEQIPPSRSSHGAFGARGLLKKNESSIISKARRETRKIAKHFDSPALKKPTPTIARNTLSSDTPLSNGIKRMASQDVSSPAKKARPPATSSNGPAFKSKAMSSLLRKMR